MHNKGDPLSAPTYPLMRKRISVTSGDQELPQVKLFLMKKSRVMNGDIGARLVRVWVMMP